MSMKKLQGQKIMKTKGRNRAFRVYFQERMGGLSQQRQEEFYVKQVCSPSRPILLCASPTAAPTPSSFSTRCSPSNISLNTHAHPHTCV